MSLRVMILIAGLLLSCGGAAAAQAGSSAQPQSAQTTPAAQGDCQPCWIEPWLCKKPACHQPVIQPLAPTPERGQPRRGGGRRTRWTGMVRSFGIVQEEPGETPQASFYLDVSRRDGHVESLLVSLPAREFRCGDRGRVTVEGEFARASGAMPAVVLAARVVSCWPHRARGH